MRVLAFDDVMIDLPTGKITVAGTTPSLPETVTLAVCVGVLFVMCQRRAILGFSSVKSYRSVGGASMMTDTSSTAGSVNKRRMMRQSPKLSRKNYRRTNRRKMSASFTFLLACGLQVDMLLPTPRNSLSRADARPLNDVVDSSDVKPHLNGVLGLSNHTKTDSLYDSGRDDPERYKDVKL